MTVICPTGLYLNGQGEYFAVLAVYKKILGHDKR